MAIVSVIALLPIFFTYAFTEPTHAKDCRVEMTNVDTGHLEVTAQQILGYGHHTICTWVLSSQPGKKLNAAVENVSLPSDASKLTVLVDRVRHDVPAKCHNCLENLVGSVLTVNLSLTDLPNVSDPDGNLFTVRYWSFDPRRCEHPKRPEPHGQVVGKGRKVGERIWYSCRKPYRLVGSSENVCQAGKGPLAPTWKEATPSCLFQECGDGLVKLALDTGFVEYSMMDSASPDAPTSCTWQVTTAPDKRIRVQVERLNLATRAPEAALYIFDGERTPENELLKMTGNHALPVNASTTGNVLTVVFHAGNLSGLDAASDFGFRLSYGAFASLAPRCRKLGVLRQGTVVNGHSAGAGSVVSFTCDNDTVLVGKDSAVCLPTGKWSSEMPTCLPVEVDVIPAQDSSTEMSSNSQLASRPEASETPKEAVRLNATGTGLSRDGDGTFGSPRIQKEQVPHHMENDNFKPGYSEDVAVPEDLDTVHPTDKPNDPTDSAELPWLIIIIGVAAPLALVILGILIFLIYRKKYPVRMSLGRRFETFENPVYELKKKEVPDQLLQDPNELLRLTTN